jgi:hypothetical protein
MKPISDLPSRKRPRRRTSYLASGINREVNKHGEETRSAVFNLFVYSWVWRRGLLSTFSLEVRVEQRETHRGLYRYWEVALPKKLIGH